MALDFLRSCDEVNETRFELLSLVSLGYVLGEMLLIIGIDVVGRKPYLSKPPRSLSLLRSSNKNALIKSQNSAFFIRSVFYIHGSQIISRLEIIFIIVKVCHFNLIKE